MPIRILTFSSLYPNSKMPRHGIFVEQRLRHLLRDGRVEGCVVAPSPWFPFRGAAFGAYAAYADVPRTEARHGIEVSHPRYPVIPKVGMSLASTLMHRAVRRHVHRLCERMRPQLIDAHYFYPDGVAAVEIGSELGLPVVVTARGSDVSLIPQYPRPRRAILRAAERCAAIISVSGALKGGLVELGVPAERVVVLRNGVDLNLFRPVDAVDLRSKLGRGRRVLLSVGLLIERKGHELAIAALPSLPECHLVIVGHGPMADTLHHLARSLGVEERVTFVPHVVQERLPEYYSAADALILMSSREGMANVLLESLACGTPAVASNAWGTTEVVAAEAAGIVLRERTTECLVAGVTKLLAAPPDRCATRAFAERFSWDATTNGQVDLFESVLQGARAA